MTTHDEQPQESDEQIARKVQDGDKECFGDLVERYQDKLIRYARRFLLTTDDATDIVQDVFIKAYENIQSFDASRRFSPWIYRIAHNEFINLIKRRKSRETLFAFDFDTMFPHLVAAEASDDVALGRELRATVEKHLETLDPKYREPLVLYYLEEMDYKAISDILQIPISTVGVRLARGKAQLQKYLQRHDT